MSSSILLDLRHLKTQYQTKAGPILAVNDVSMQLKRGEILGLVGESGSGKSVTGFSIMGLINKPGQIIGGEVYFKGQDLRKFSEKSMKQLRGNRIAMIFQDPMMTLNPVLRIDTQMVETIRAHEKVTTRQARERAIEMLGLLGIASPETRLKAYPHQLSGGMRQRVAIAIALLMHPDLIIADEPTTALDVTIQAQILSEVQKLSQKYGTALIWITHDLSVVAGLADRLAVMYAGQIVETGTVDQVLDNPQHPYTEGLIRSLPINNKRGERLAQIKGTTPNLTELPTGCAFSTRCLRVSPVCRVAPELIAYKDDGQQVRCFHPSHEFHLLSAKSVTE